MRSPLLGAFRAACFGFVVFGAASKGIAQPESGAPTLHTDAEFRLEQIGADVRRSFESALAAYDSEIALRPYDVVLRTDKCRFIDQFTYTFEYVDWIDEVYARADECTDALTAEFAEHPEVILLKLENLYGEELLAVGRALDSQAPLLGWTVGQMARLYGTLAVSANTFGDENAGKYALRALELDESAPVPLIAAAELMDRGERDRAIEILETLRLRDPEDRPWEAAARIHLLVELGAHESAIAAYESLVEDGRLYNRIEVARSLRDADAIELSRLEFERAAEEQTFGSEDERALFEFEYRFGSTEQAYAAYSRLRDLGWEQDPLAINRMSLLYKDVSLPWRPRDALGLLGAAGTIAVLAMFALVPIATVHYRGLARRARRGEPNPPLDGWQLRHAWFAMLGLATVLFLSLYFAGPLDLFTETDGALGVEFSAVRLANPAIAQSILEILLLVPFAFTAAFTQPTSRTLAWSPAVSVAVGIGIALAFRLPSLLAYSVFGNELWQSLVREIYTWQIMLAVRDSFGLWTALSIVAIVAPLVEEFIFRGVVLSALSKHISFGWANVIQAAIFAGLHQEAPALPYLFVFGVVAGYVTKRSGRLTAAITMHCVFNGMLSLLVLVGD
jgi:hypothetical protein